MTVVIVGVAEHVIIEGYILMANILEATITPLVKSETLIV